MTTYGGLLLGQTLLALVALGVCGGWVLWPFRREERPYLWLAAPLAGLFALGGALAVLYFGARLPFRWCLWTGFALNAVATVACLVRGRPQLPSRGQLIVAAGVVLAAVYWATVVCNRTAIEHEEPTLLHVHNNDMFNYAMGADWLREHSASEPPRSDRPFETITHINLVVDGSRSVTFLLLCGASEVRGTSALFSFDWWTGVVLAAGILGFGGLFATSSLMLVLLVFGAGLSAWPTNARTGFLGKHVAYPGAMMLSAFYLAALARLSWARVAVVVALGVAVAFSLNSVFPPVLLGVVLCGYALALAVVPSAESRRSRGVQLLAAILLWAAATLPAFAWHRLLFTFMPPPPPPTKWSVVIPVSLDLELPTIPTFPAGWRAPLALGTGAALAAALAAGVRQRSRSAVALSACALLVPAAWAAGEYRLHTFHGLIYPLTLAGAAALGAGLRGRGRALLAALMVGMIGLRAPQHALSGSWYLYQVLPGAAVLKQSEIEELRTAVGNETVDFSSGFYADNNLVLTELGARGVPVHLRPPAWERTLEQHSALFPPHDLFAPKSRFSLVERNAYAPPGTVRYVGSRYKLVEDRDAFAVIGILAAQDIVWNVDGLPRVWIGNTPTTFLLHNGTGRPQLIRLHADTLAGPARTLVYRLGEQTGKLSLPGANTAAIPLRLTPGLNRVELAVEEPAQPSIPTQPVRLLEFRNWVIEPVEHPAALVER